MSEENGDRYFVDGPPDGSSKHRVSILRCPPTGMPACVVLSDDLVQAFVHYWGGRSVPCTRSIHCRACLAGETSRRYGYLFVQSHSGKTTGLLEVTAPVCYDLHQLRERRGTLRGSVLHLTRKPPVKNGGLYVEVEPSLHDPAKLDAPPDVKAILLRLWRVAEVSTEEAPVADELS